MDTKKLRQKILDLAIRGKLVPQDPNDEPASVLLERIRTEKQQLIKEGKIKASKGSKACDTSHYEKIEGPFEIPESWEWCRLGDICHFENGYAFSSHDYRSQGTPLIRISNIQNGSVIIDRSICIAYDVDSRFIISKGDLLIAMSGATTGKMGIYKDENEAYLNQRVGNIKITTRIGISERYRNLFMLSQSDNILKQAYGGAQPNISSTAIEEMYLPLPPISEQKRIVDAVEHIMNLIDFIESGTEDISHSITKTISVH